MASLTDTLAARAAALVDRAMIAAVRVRSRTRPSRAEGLPPDERLRRLALASDAYAPVRTDTDTFFPPPPPITPTLRDSRRTLPDSVRVLDASWPSTSEPFLADVRDRYLAHEPNRTAHARLYLAPRPRAAVILVHGYLGGHWSVEEMAWPIEWMARRGLDVALTVLPFHGLRALTSGGPPPFPGPDPRVTNEGFRQGVADIRALLGFLRARGAPSVGVMGMSLGGYTTALLATIEELAFAVPLIPLSSVADFARDQGRLGDGPLADAQHRALEDANRVVSPFARAPRVPGERMLVVGAEADRITPIAQAERIARHFGAPLVRLRGGHLLQLWRRDAFRAVRALWQRLGII